MNIRKKNLHTIWIGLAKVQAKNHSTILNNTSNAFVNVLAKAKNRNEFRRKIKEAFLENELELKRLEDAETLLERRKKFVLPRNILKQAKELKREKQVVFDTFYTYD